MDARGVERMLDKLAGLANTAPAVSARTIEGVARDARLSDPLKQKVIPLYREESLRRAQLYAGLGLAICRALATELDDETARARLELYRAGFAEIYAHASRDLQAFAGSHELELT